MLKRWMMCTLVVAMAWSGCGSSFESAWDTTPEANANAPLTEAQRAERDASLAAAETAWSERSDEAQLRVAIEKWEAALAMDRDDYGTWVRLARGYYFLGDGHLSFDEARLEEMIAAHGKARESAETALMVLSEEFAQRMRAGTRIEEAIVVLNADAVPALYWRSAAVGKWALAKGFATILSYKDEIRAIMARCLELDASYFYSGPHRYFGAFYAKVPTFAGGNLDRARAHFEQALRANPEYLGTRTLYAELYAFKSQDRALFEEQLRLVVEADADATPDIGPENRVEQRKARALLERADEMFE